MKQNVNITGNTNGNINVAGKNQTVNKENKDSPWYIKIIKLIISWFNFGKT